MSKVQVNDLNHYQIQSIHTYCVLYVHVSHVQYQQCITITHYFEWLQCTCVPCAHINNALPSLTTLSGYKICLFTGTYHWTKHINRDREHNG